MVAETIIITEAVKSTISGVVNKIVVPKIDSLLKKMNLQYKDLLIPRGEHFVEYLSRVYKRNSVVNTLVLRNNQMLLKNIYIPLTIIIDKDKEEVVINGYPQELMKKYQYLLITDTAGMGKSTIAKRMFLDVVDNGYGIPIFIDLRRLSSNKSILEEIHDQINSLEKQFDTQLLLHFLQSGDFIFFFDGYDEIPLKYKESVTTDIQNFITKASANKFVLTSRPEDSLASFGIFQKSKIKPLTKKESYELLRKYDNQGETSRNLIEKLKSGNYAMIDDFLQNPLLVSLLFAAFDYKQTIPLKKHIFYRQVYDAYFDSHDLSKGDSFIHDKKSGLGTDDFNRILRHVGFICLKKASIEFSKDEMIKIISDAKSLCRDLIFEPSNLLDDLLKAVPLFCIDGNYYKWAHKSLQEYFAAQYIYLDSKKNQEILLKHLYSSNKIDRYYNLLDIYYDIDSFGFNKCITRQYLADFFDFYDKNYRHISGISDDSIRKRISLLYRCEYILIESKQIEKPFESIDKILQQPICENFNSISCIKDKDERNLYVIIKSDQLNQLNRLLYSKKTDLFYNIQDKDEKKIKRNMLEKGKPYLINSVSLFSTTQDDYDNINLSISYMQLHIDYQKAKNYIKEIDDRIAASEDMDNIVGGL